MNRMELVIRPAYIQTPPFLPPSHPLFPYQSPIDYRAILPQINLTQNLPLVSNLPPESFSTKDPHLLKPPAVMGLAAPSGWYSYYSTDWKKWLGDWENL